MYIVTAAGTSFEQVKKVPLYMLDHETELNNLTSVYVPVQERASLYQQFDVLREIIAELRGEMVVRGIKANTSIIKEIFN